MAALCRGVLPFNMSTVRIIYTEHMAFFSRSNKATNITQFDLQGHVLVVDVRENARARRLTMRLNKTGDGLKITVPPRTGEAAVLDFLARHQGWISARMDERPDVQIPAANGFIPINGSNHRIIHHTGRGTSHVRNVINAETGEQEPQLHIFGDVAHLSRRVADYLKRAARKELEGLSLQYAGQLGKKPSRIQMKDTTSRWGSCSSTGTLSYSWRIIMAPPDILDYLVAHEVAHLKEMNHSHHFWRVVASLCPDYERHRNWLKRHGNELHAWRFD